MLKTTQCKRECKFEFGLTFDTHPFFSLVPITLDTSLLFSDCYTYSAHTSTRMT